MCCIQIEILNPPSHFPKQYKKNGKVLLDLPLDFSSEVSKFVNELTNINEFKTEGVTPFSTDFTPTNDKLFSFLRIPNTHENKLEPYQVFVSGGGMANRFSLLYGITCNKQAKTYELELRQGNAHWAIGAKNTFLKDIDFGVFNFTKDNVLNNISTQDRYIDGNIGVYFPFIDFGDWLNNESIFVEDLRPIFHHLHVIKKGLAHLGWGFRCPYLETDEGRRKAAYILKENYGNDERLLEERKFRVARTEQQGEGKIDFDEVITGQGFDIDNDYFSGVGVYNFTLKGLINDTNPSQSSSSFTSTVYIKKRDSNGNTYTLASKSFTIRPDEDLNGGFELSIDKVSIAPNEFVYCEADVSTTFGSVEECEFYNEPIQTYYQKGDTIVLNETINPSYTVLDFIKGAAHEIKGKVHTDWNNRTVYLYSPYDVEINGEVVEGYYKNEVQKINNVICNSSITTAESVNLKRFVKLKYKTSTDSYIGSKDFPNGSSPFEYILDRGEEYENNTDELENPFFEPTLNARVDRFSVNTGTSLDMPVMHDNSDGKTSFKIGARSLYISGEIEQFIKLEYGAFRQSNYIFEGSVKTTMPYAFQVANSLISENFSSPEIPSVKIVYGVDENDHFNRFYKRELLIPKHSTKTDIQSLLTPSSFQRIDFRKMVEVSDGGLPIIGRLIGVSGFKECELSGTSLIIQTVPYIGSVCSDLQDGVECENSFSFNPNIKSECIDLTATDNFNSNVVDDIWQYSIDGGQTWLSYTPEQLVCSGESDDIIFRRAVSFEDGCPDIIRTFSFSFSSQCNNTADIVLNIDGNEISATGTQTFSSEVETDTWTVQVDEGATQNYNEGEIITNFSDVTFTRTITFQGVCPDIVISRTYSIEPPICNNTPTLTITEIADCVYTLEVDEGANDSEIHMAIFEIEKTDGTIIPYNGTSYSGDFSFFRATVFYCDGCPPVCLSYECPN